MNIAGKTSIKNNQQTHVDTRKLFCKLMFLQYGVTYAHAHTHTCWDTFLKQSPQCASIHTHSASSLCHAQNTNDVVASTIYIYHIDTARTCDQNTAIMIICKLEKDGGRNRDWRAMVWLYDAAQRAQCFRSRLL